MPYADRIHLTRIDYVYDADTFFPEISPNEWSLTDVSDEQTYFDLIYDFRCYERKTKNKTAYMMTMPARNSSGKVS